MAISNALLLLAAAICCLPILTSTTVSWPKPVDDFDAHLINLARSKRASDDLEDTLTTTVAPAAAEKNVTKKNFTIDWNEVQRNWEKILSEEEVKKKWDDMETSTKNGKSEAHL